MKYSMIWTAAVLVVGGLLGWLAASAWMLPGYAQDKPGSAGRY